MQVSILHWITKVCQMLESLHVSLLGLNLHVQCTTMLLVLSLQGNSYRTLEDIQSQGKYQLTVINVQIMFLMGVLPLELYKTLFVLDKVYQ